MNQKVGGIANQVLQLLPAYEKINGLKVSVFSKYSKYKPNTNRIKIYNIQKFSNIQKFALRTVNTLYFYLKFFIKVKKLAKEDPIHLIHQQNYGFYLMGPLVVAKILHIPILIKTPADIKSHMMHAYLSRQHGIITKMLIYGWFNLFKKIIIKKIDFIQALNDRIYDDLISLNFPKGNILKLPNGICLDNFQNIKKINKEFTTFGYIGRLEKHKNVDFLLHTFKEYLKIYPSDKLYIFGKGTEAKNLTTI
ncbi:MAG: glycosyltransferase, partial [Promethearchaeota archaeon]